MMKKTYHRIVLIALLCVAVLLAGCGAIPKALNQPQPGDADYEPQTFESKMGETNKTYFFDFTVDSVAMTDTYGGYTAADGMQLADVVVTLKNTFGEAIPMFNSDFQIQWGEGEEDYNYGVEGISDATVMPEEFELAKDEKGTYHIIFEVPQGTTAGDLAYLEVFDDESTGNSYFVAFTA